MAWCWRSAKPLTVPMLTYCQLDPYNQTSMKFDGKYKHFYSKQILENVVSKMGAFCSDSNVLRKPWEDFIIGYANVDLFDRRFGTTWHISTAYLHVIHTMFHIVIGQW